MARGLASRFGRAPASNSNLAKSTSLVPGERAPALMLARVWSLAAAWLPMSDTGSEGAVGAVAALLLAGFSRLASTRRIKRRRGVLAVALRASRAERGVSHP